MSPRLIIGTNVAEIGMLSLKIMKEEMAAISHNIIRLSSVPLATAGSAKLPCACCEP